MRFTHLRCDKASKDREEEGNPVETASNPSRDSRVEERAHHFLAVGDDSNEKKRSSQSTNDLEVGE